MNVREILQNIPGAQRAALMTAFNAGKTLTYEFEPGLFVGVNVKPAEGLEIVETVGLWSAGRITRVEDIPIHGA